MSIEGQGHFFTIYFPGFVCFVLNWAKISGERLQDHWSSGFEVLSNTYSKPVKVTLSLVVTPRHDNKLTRLGCHFLLRKVSAFTGLWVQE